MFKLLAIGAILFGAYFAFWPQVQFTSLSKQDKLNYLIKQDLQSLKEKGYLPQAWNKISAIEVYGEDGVSAKWLDKMSFPIRLNPKGDRRLEIQVLSWKIKGQLGAVINYHIFDRKTKNMVWEFGRTFTLDKVSSPAKKVVKEKEKKNS